MTAATPLTDGLKSRFQIGDLVRLKPCPHDRLSKKDHDMLAGRALRVQGLVATVDVIAQTEFTSLYFIGLSGYWNESLFYQPEEGWQRLRVTAWENRALAAEKKLEETLAELRKIHGQLQQILQERRGSLSAPQAKPVSE